METVFAFALVLFVGVLISGLAHRSVLSTAVLFLLGGVLLGDTGVQVVSIAPEDPVFSTFVELALFAVLFTDGMQLGAGDLRRSWRLPGRALLLGMPLAFLFTAMIAYLLLDLSWVEAFLIGAVLSPTDPVFASAIVGRTEVPERLRRMLNVESGVNDGLALPVVILLLEVISGDEVQILTLLFEVALGIAIGIAVPWIAIQLERIHWFSTSQVYEPLNVVAIGMVVFSLAALTHGNEFLAAFSAGVTVSTIGPQLRDAFHRFGELIAELLKLAALFLFGALVAPDFLTDIGITGGLFVALVLILVRPAALVLVLIRSGLNWPERITAMWFGPKGFASVAYGLLILEAAVEGANYMFHVIAVVIAASIIAHSSTDVLIARWFVEDRRVLPTWRSSGYQEQGRDTTSPD